MPSHVSRTTPLLAAVLAVIAVLLVPSPPSHAAEGRILHVKEGGEDRDRYVCHIGSAEEPWGTIEDAFRCLEPGDTLYIHPGTYHEVVSLGDSTSRGTADRPILVTGAPGEDRPVIVGSLRIGNPDWWTVQDLEIVGDGNLDYDKGGLHPLKMVGGHDWTVQRVEVRDAAAYALVRIEPARDGTPPANWRVIDSCIHDTLPHPAHSPGKAPYTDHNLYVHTGPGAGPGLIEGNVLFGASNGQNIKLGNSGGQNASDATDNVTVRFNTMVDAAQNMTVVGPSNDNLIERNLLTEVNYGEPWYPNIRGIHLSGTGNIARDNAWLGAAEAVHNRTGNTTEVIDGGNRKVAEGFDGRGCDGFLPTDRAAAAYGANPRDLAEVDIPVDRVAGGDRIATAVKISKEVHARAGTVLLARSDAYPDALASSALAGLHRVPVLLTSPDGVSATVLDEIDRLEATRVVLLGGEAALGDGVEADLRSAGVGHVGRMAGPNRYATAARVADEVYALHAEGVSPQVDGSGDEVILVEGSNPDPRRGWPDAVSAGQLAAATGTPILLTEAGALPEDTRRWLRDNRPGTVTIVGGKVAVSDAVAAEVDRLAGRVRRLAGGDRYATAESVAYELTARRGFDVPPDRTFVASGQSFPDAMAVGPAAALVGSVVVLYGSGEDAYQRLRDFVAPVDASDLRVTVVGGSVAVPETLEQRWQMDAAAGD